MEQFSRVRNINITINNDEWERENGISVLKAEDFIRKNFILLMGDPIFDESILLELKNQKIANDEIMLSVDYNIKNNEFVNADDATKVNVQSNNIAGIGKNISIKNAAKGNKIIATAFFQVIFRKSIIKSFGFIVYCP